jgi:carbonic anhydrase
MELHGTKTVILMLHSDCGAYGGLKAFDSAEMEAENHRQEMHRAARYLKEKFPQLEIKAFFVDFSGVWEADLGLPAEKIA